VKNFLLIITFVCLIQGCDQIKARLFEQKVNNSVADKDKLEKNQPSIEIPENKKNHKTVPEKPSKNVKMESNSTRINEVEKQSKKNETTIEEKKVENRYKVFGIGKDGPYRSEKSSVINSGTDN
tara:strand:+ start:6032 stop:6403 length:372 start_codon:yes stop_codon:yes gene_type:complete